MALSKILRIQFHYLMVIVLSYIKVEAAMSLNTLTAVYARLFANLRSANIYPQTLTEKILDFYQKWYQLLHDPRQFLGRQ